MTTLDQTDLHQLKEDPENEEDCCTHDCRHFRLLIRMRWKIIASKRSSSGGSFHTTHDMHYLEQNYNEEGRTSVEASLQEKEEKDAKRAEEIALKIDFFIKRKVLREEDDDDIFYFVITDPVDQPVLENLMSEEERR